MELTKKRRGFKSCWGKKSMVNTRNSLQAVQDVFLAKKNIFKAEDDKCT